MPLRWLLYLALIAAPAVSWNGDFPLDDAYITMHNARALYAGADATYGLSPLTGATSLVHLLLVAILGLALPLPWASFVVSLGGAAGYAVALDRLAANLESWRRPALVSIGLAIGTVPNFLVNGLETSLAMAVVAWLLALRDDKRLSLLVGLSPFVRPELAILGVALLARQMLALDGRDRVRSLLSAAAVAAPFAAWSLIETGHLLPGTMAAKVAFFRDNDVGFVARLAAPVMSLAGYGLAPLLLGLLGLRSGPSWVFLAAVLGTGIALIHGAFDWNEGRYLAPLLPVLLMGIADSRRTVVIAFVAAWAAIFLPGQLNKLVGTRAWYQVERNSLAAALGMLPRGTVVLVHDAGLPAWAAPHLRLVDVVGLKTPTSVAAHEELTRRGCQWGRALSRIAAQSRAEYVLVLQRPYWRCVGDNLRDQGWRMQTVGSDDYQLFRIARR